MEEHAVRFKQPIGELPNVIAHVRKMELINPFKDIPVMRHSPVEYHRPSGRHVGENLIPACA